MDKTTQPQIQPRYLRPGDVRTYCGLSRARVYELLGSGDLKSVSLRQPGTNRGIRLICRESLDALLASCAD